MSVHHTNIGICPLCLEKLKDADIKLYTWFYLHVRLNWPNAHISCTFRGPHAQEKAWLEGKTTLHFPDSLHNKKPARAIDLFQIDENGKGVWDKEFFSELNYYNRIQDINLKWGGEFKELKDYCHFELPKHWLRRLYERIIGYFFYY